MNKCAPTFLLSSGAWRAQLRNIFSAHDWTESNWSPCSACIFHVAWTRVSYIKDRVCLWPCVRGRNWKQVKALFGHDKKHKRQPHQYNDCAMRLTSLRSPLMHAASCTSSLRWKFRTTATSGTPCAWHSETSWSKKKPMQQLQVVSVERFSLASSPIPRKRAQQFSAPTPFASVKVTSYLAVIPRLCIRTARRHLKHSWRNPRVAAGASGRFLAESGFPTL